MHEDRIESDPAVRHGKPIIKGRVPLEGFSAHLQAACRSMK